MSDTGGSDSVAREKLVEVVEERSIEAFAQVYAAAQANYNGEGDCSAEVRTPHHTFPVSYTHLTLPTIPLV